MLLSLNTNSLGFFLLAHHRAVQLFCHQKGKLPYAPKTTLTAHVVHGVRGLSLDYLSQTLPPLVAETDIKVKPQDVVNTKA